MRIPIPTMALLVSTIALAADQPHKLSEIVLPGDALPGGCAFDESAHAISIQAATQYSEDYSGQIAGAKPIAKQAQAMRCGGGAGVIYYYEYSSAADADKVLKFIKTLIWGEDHPTSMHPELINQWGNIVVVTSFRHPKPIADHVMARVGASAGAGSGRPEVPRGAKEDFEKGQAAYLVKDYRKAEKHFRALTKSIPDFGFAHLYLGHSLFYQEKYPESIPEYEKALALGGASEEMKQRDERILNDQLGMAYGLSGRLEDAKRFFEGAIKKDPEYPLYYYMLACAEAELGDLDAALTNLKLTFERKANFLPGETYPNPREDDSFKRYLGNPKFEGVMKEIGF